MTSYVKEAVHCLSLDDVYKATKYVSPRCVVKATRKRFGRKINNSLDSIEINLTIGSPNVEEKKFIKDCLDSRERFPVRKVQLKTVS